MPEIAPRYWIMIIVLGFVWGGTFMLVELALRGITPFWLAAGRIGFAALLLGSVWGLRGFQLFKQNTSWPPLLVIGVFSTTVPFMLLSWGLQHTTSSFAGISMGTVPLIIVVLAHFLLPGEKMGPRRIIGTALGFVGIVVLFGGKALSGSGSQLEWLGQLACISTALCYATSSILTRRLPAIDPVGLAAMQLIIGACVIVPAAWTVEGPPPLPDATTGIWLAVLGLGPTAAANFLRVLVVRGAGPVFMSLTSYQIPVWSVLLGAVFLKEAISYTLIVALGFILSGIAISQFKNLKKMFGL
ncbi:EamA family transporter [Epibacterium sp. SM1969]|uniref:EamA family transporter n=1 Tax=Tritonibacter aquimaris TaxID=2663379 RepID=A0A844AME6_9RHOB|nr:DMT family transporter [Tritonibacter aquimaris]MQY43139.1 EamA family transporter [Tritonibacter aquimaris]